MQSYFDCHTLIPGAFLVEKAGRQVTFLAGLSMHDYCSRFTAPRLFSITRGSEVELNRGFVELTASRIRRRRTDVLLTEKTVTNRLHY